MSDPINTFAPPDSDNEVTSECNTSVPAVSFGFNGSPTGVYVPPDICFGTLDYSTSDCATIESNYISSLMAEALQYAAGPVNIFPMLGVHNQGSTIDQPGNGFAISSGTPGGFNAADAFNVNTNGWQSIQTGSAVTLTPAYIGYDFGTKKAWTAIGPPQERYVPGAPVRLKVSTIKITQGANSGNRALQVRIEASDDGVTWTRIDAANLPDTATQVTISVRSNAAYNKWRIVPTFFNGVANNLGWQVLEIHMLEMTQVSLENIEDFVLLENRDRAYCRTSTFLKCTYDLLDVQTELAKFGINLPQTYIFTCSFAVMVSTLGRPVVVGDIVELPGEIQYDTQLRSVRKWLEVTDAGWSTEGYTQNWKPQLFRFYAQPLMPSIEHKDILGTPGSVNALQTDSDFLTNGFLQTNQGFDSETAIKQTAADLVPQDGEDPQDIQSGMSTRGVPGSYDGRDLYAEDAIPPNGLPYTMGDALPTGVADGAYHRQTYTAVPASLRPADRLLQYSATTGRWRPIEINKRSVPESQKKTIAQFLASGSSQPIDQKP
jgi:hypothetical protein